MPRPKPSAGFSHQDWAPQAAHPAAAASAVHKTHKPAEIARAQQANQPVTVTTRHDAGHNRQHGASEHLHMKKIENEEDAYVHKTVDRSLAVNLRRARAKRELTQAQLAHAMNEKAAVIQSYESGNAIPNGSLIAKMEKALGLRLRGPQALEPLGKK